MSTDLLDSSPLGKKSAVVSSYDPAQLCPVPRQLVWKEYAYTEAPYFGVDIWNAYEISWLNSKGLPQVAVGEFRVPLNSPKLVESKSLKLYLNSFSQTKFADIGKISATIAADLSACAGEKVEVALFTLDNVTPVIHNFDGSCIDNLDVSIESYSRDASLLRVSAEQVRNEKLFSHLLKSNCPVTGQPDWGSLYIEYSGHSINHESLLKYIVSYRDQSDFHEQCCENIFLDIMQHCQPEELTIYARYLRRGGLDINPYRSTNPAAPLNTRLFRQ